jgi:hypothetical protein
MRCCGMRASFTGATVGAASAVRNACRGTTTILCMNAAAAVSTTTEVTTASTPTEAMITPAVAIAPACPWTDTEKDAVIEITRSVKAHRGASVW